jgi:hypothetical protein
VLLLEVVVEVEVAAEGPGVEEVAGEVVAGAAAAAVEVAGVDVGAEEAGEDHEEVLDLCLPMEHCCWMFLGGIDLEATVLDWQVQAFEETEESS